MKQKKTQPGPHLMQNTRHRQCFDASFQCRQNFKTSAQGQFLMHLNKTKTDALCMLSLVILFATTCFQMQNVFLT